MAGWIHRLVIDELRAPTRELRQAIPDAWSAFGDLHRSALGDGAIPARLMETVAVAVAGGRDGYIAYHARGAARAGALPDDVAEVLAVTLLMEGGQATIDGPQVWEAYQVFREEPNPRAARG